MSIEKKEEKRKVTGADPCRLQREGLAGHELEVRHGQLDAHAADLQFGVAVVAHGRHFDVGLEGLRVSLLELLQLGGPGQWADNVDVDVIRAHSVAATRDRPRMPSLAAA